MKLTQAQWPLSLEVNVENLILTKLQVRLTAHYQIKCRPNRPKSLTPYSHNYCKRQATLVSGLFNALYMKRSEHKASRPPRVMR